MNVSATVIIANTSKDFEVCCNWATPVFQYTAPGQTFGLLDRASPGQEAFDSADSVEV